MTGNDIKILLAGNIKRYREQKGINMAQLAKSIGVTRGLIHYIEKAHTYPSSNVLAKICNALGVSVVELFEGV